MSYGMYKQVYDSGRAVGEVDIRTDSMVFRYNDEVFEIPLSSGKINPYALHNGYFYEIPIERLRKIMKE